MSKRLQVALAGALSAAALIAAAVLGAQAAFGVGHEAKPQPGCKLGNGIKHVIYIQFDNTHLFRDRVQFQSDLEQMPHLLSFLRNNGTLDDNDHTVLISHTSNGILSSLTGLYPDRHGVTVGNSYRYFKADKTTASTGAFNYWTDLVDTVNTPPFDPLPNMVNGDSGSPKITPAPWVPYTRAGCNVGGVGLANIELENTGTGPNGDITKVFGNPSPQATEASTNPQLALTDFVGFAVHCAKNAAPCKGNANARTDSLPDEPGGYAGFQGLFGAKYVDPAISDDPANPCIPSTDGSPIADARGNCGFPGFDGMFAKNTLGQIAQLQEHNVPVTFGYISDAHDIHTPNPTADSFASSATGPGEAPFKKQLKEYDDAFAAFFKRLANDRITKENTLFLFTVDENDHLAAGNSFDGTWSHTFCNVSAGDACPGNQLGEVNLNINSTLPTNASRPVFSVHSDSAPTYYVNGQPNRDDVNVRQLERDVAGAQAIDPYLSKAPMPVTVWMVDPIGEKAIHMVNADPNRTPTFTQFANPDYFISTFNTNCPDAAHSVANCISPGFAWSHGDATDDIGQTWVGLVGPHVKQLGQTSEIWSDHTDFQPTMLALTGLKDDYRPDGRVLWEALDGPGLPRATQEERAALIDLANVYKQLEAPFGQFGKDAILASTRAIKSGSSSDDSTYTRIENQLNTLTNQRDSLAAQMSTVLTDAGLNDKRVNAANAKSLAAQGRALLNQADALATGP
jgi:hypothetical protein